MLMIGAGATRDGTESKLLSEEVLSRECGVDLPSSEREGQEKENSPEFLLSDGAWGTSQDGSSSKYGLTLSRGSSERDSSTATAVGFETRRFINNSASERK